MAYSILLQYIHVIDAYVKKKIWASVFLGFTCALFDPLKKENMLSHISASVHFVN